jgi:hypothetical protein
MRPLPALLAVLLATGLPAQVRRHYQVGPAVHGNEDSFVDPEEGRPGLWLGENALVSTHGEAATTLWAHQGEEVTLLLEPQTRPGHRLRYLVRASDNLLILRRPEEKEGPEGLRITVAARLKDGRPGAIVVYYWSYLGNEITGYGRAVHPILQDATPGASSSALSYLQPWGECLKNW